MKKIFISSDHAGYEVKELVKKDLHNKKYNVIDLGTNSLESVDYPDYAIKLGKEVAKDKNSLGIIICGTGIGISIACNKVKGIRAAILYSDEVAALAKEHNNANVISFGARTMTLEDILRRIEIFQSSEFNKRHEIRLNKIADYEKETDDE